MFMKGGSDDTNAYQKLANNMKVEMNEDCRLSETVQKDSET